MGNCLDTTMVKPTASEISQSELIKPNKPIIQPDTRPIIKLYGPPDSFATSHIRLALLYKPVQLQFIPTGQENENPKIVFQNDVVSGSVDDILRYLDTKFPENPISSGNVVNNESVVDNVGSSSGIWGWNEEKKEVLVVLVVKLQHRSLVWHLERVVKWAEDLVTRGGKAKGDPSMGSVRMEIKKFARSYSNLLQVLLEHAQMEERVVFQVLENADRGLCKAANEEHARDLPLMNGIKEEIKTVGVMSPGGADYQETLLSILTRLRKLRDNCKHHFEEEERDLLPLMEATELKKSQQEKVLRQSLEAMRDTHSHMFRFFMEGLQPQDAMRYFDLVKKHCDTVRVSLMLHMMVD